MSNLRSLLTSGLKKFNRNTKKPSERSDAKSFIEKQKDEAAVDRKDLGLQEVPVHFIVGSVGRYNDFDGQFRLKTNRKSARYTRIKEAYRLGKKLPPPQLYKIKDEYFVLDGNHRVAAAKTLGHTNIVAHIVEYLPSKDTLANILYRERTQFHLISGLPDVIEVTEVGQYEYILNQIRDNQRALSQITGTDMSSEEAAEDWYNFIYIPFINILNQHKILDAFPKRTQADLYVYVSYHQWHKNRTDRTYNAELVGLLSSSMEKFRVKVMEQSEHPFPEMRRVTTAFVMISVKPKLENQIIEKLYAFTEVQEIHNVPADFDIIAKIVLERDLLSSDSEIVGKFIQEQVRRLPGITWTQTIIPLSSKVKTPKDRLR